MHFGPTLQEARWPVLRAVGLCMHRRFVPVDAAVQVRESHDWVSDRGDVPTHKRPRDHLGPLGECLAGRADVSKPNVAFSLVELSPLIFQERPCDEQHHLDGRARSKGGGGCGGGISGIGILRHADSPMDDDWLWNGLVAANFQAHEAAAAFVVLPLHIRPPGLQTQDGALAACVCRDGAVLQRSERSSRVFCCCYVFV